MESERSIQYRQFVNENKNCSKLMWKGLIIFAGLGVLAGSVLAILFTLLIPAVELSSPPLPIKAVRIASGYSVGLISPASPYKYEVANTTQYLQNLNSTFNSFGLRVVYGDHMSDIYG
jgi:hypothetical protein